MHHFLERTDFFIFCQLTWQNELINSGRKETTINKINSRLVDVFNYAVKYFGLPKNPCIESVGKQKRDADSIDFWTLDEYRAFISHASAIEYRIIYELLFCTGMRIGELRALTISDIDFDKKTIRIDKTLPRGAGKATTPKTFNSYRTISVPSEVMADLKEYNIRQIRIQDLRHSHVSLLINLDCSIMMIADRIGDTPATVQSTYAHLYPEKKDIVLEKLEKIISK